MFSNKALALVVAAMVGVIGSTPMVGHAAEDAKTIVFDNAEALTGWTVTGDVTVEAAKGRDGKGGALKVGPGGKALLKLGDTETSGTVVMWVYDDLTFPKTIRASRVGPRWGLVQNDGRVLAVGALYASYLGGNEGYTAMACDGARWHDQLFWLGVKRAPAGWRKWTFVFDTTQGLRVYHGDKELSKNRPLKVDAAKVGLKGFSGIAVWGDSGKENGQTIWVDDVSVARGGAVVSVPQPRPEAPKVEGPSPWTPSKKTIAMVTADKAPATPALEELPLKESVSQHGITWTFEKPARVGRFVTGDWYVVGPVTVTALDPKPLYGTEIPEIELDSRDLKRPAAERVRNGFMLNPPAASQVAYDSGIQNWFRPALIQKLPVAMKAGDALVSTISMPKGLTLPAQLRNKITRGKGDGSPIRTAAILTCVEAPMPADAFRPSYCDRAQKIYLSRNLKRDLLPTVPAPKSMPKVGLYVRFTERPWLCTGFFGFEEPVENMPQYGLEFGRVVGNAALMLCTDLKPEEKETLLVNFVQVGIDLGGIVRAGHPGWEAFGGHGSGRKLPIVFAGLLLGDEQLANVNKHFPKTHFGQDEQTAYGNCWTGAKVVFVGHRAIDQATGIARKGSGPYEHKHPSTWGGLGSGARRNGDKMSESYRRCCTSVGWIGQALALRLMKAEKAWNHDAFFDYCDRWMFENDAEFVKVLKAETGSDHSASWARQGQCWEEWVNEMWAAHRTAPGMPPTDGWKKPHDDSYLRKAIEKAKGK